MADSVCGALPMQRVLNIASYDIADRKRLRAALWLARRHATGGQKSVHECWMSDAERAHLLAAYSLLVDERFDRVLLARIDLQRRPMFRGMGCAPVDTELLQVR